MEASNYPVPDSGDDKTTQNFEAQDRLEAQFWRNWSIMVVLIMLTVFGLMSGVAGGLRQRVAEVWPWAGTDLALQVALSVIVLAFTGYLTSQQRKVLGMRRQLQDSLRASNRKVKRNLERLLSLLTVSRSLAKETDPQAIFDCISQTCLDTFDCNQVSMMLKDKDTGELEVRSARGHEDVSRVIGRRIKVGEGIAGWVAEHRKPVVLGETWQQNPDINPKNESLTAAMVVPILVRDELVGVLNVSSRSPEQEYTEEDLRALHVFAEHAGVASRHAEQAMWMRQTIQRLDSELSQLQQSAQPQRKAA